MKRHESAVIGFIRAAFLGGDTLTDDCGALPTAPPGQTLLVTTDVLEEGQHFRRDWHPPELLARKALMVNLSDLDASGARPLGFTLTLALGGDVSTDWLQAFLTSLGALTHTLKIPVIGGDTVGRASGLGLGITAFGAAERWLHRAQLQPGDRLYVDQPLGASLRGLRKLLAGAAWNPEQPDPDLAAHLDPRPNLGLGVRLASLPQVSTCIDLSDGLSKDLSMLAEASGTSILLEPGLPEDWIQGGEDYARCFASSLPQADLEARLGVDLWPVGRALARSSAPVLMESRGVLQPVQDLSFDHFAL